MSSTLSGFGHAIPAQCIHNEYFEKKFQLPIGWIEKRTGIKTRYYADHHQKLSDLAYEAATNAFLASNIPRNDIGMLILCTSTPDHLLPPTAPIVASNLGLQCGAFDITAACMGFLYALSMADAYVKSQQTSVLIIAANILSRRINLNDVNTAILFGDAAAAVIVSHSPNLSSGIIASNFITQGEHYSNLMIKSGGSSFPFSPLTEIDDTLLHLHDGKSLYKAATQLMVDTSRYVLSKESIHAHAIDYYLPHQSNGRMIRQTSEIIGIPFNKTLQSIQHYGNSSAATIPLTLSLHQAFQPFKNGDTLLFAAAGAGMTGGAIIYKI